MKTILFDFLSLQDRVINGGMLYTQRILSELLTKDVKIYGVYDGKRRKGDRVENLCAQHGVELVNIRSKKFTQTVKDLGVDTFFVGIAQRYSRFDLSGLSCRIVVVCHDLGDLSWRYFAIDRAKPPKRFQKKYVIPNGGLCKRIAKHILLPLLQCRNRWMGRYDYFRKLLGRDNVRVVTVSDYSKHAIQYFLGMPKNEITVTYPPFCNQNAAAKKHSCDIPKIIENKKYFLLLSADRFNKNAGLFLHQWDKFCAAADDAYHCILIGRIKANKKNCTVIPKVDSEDLGILFQNAFAVVYPSFSEGFGAPPVEAASYGVPSVCTNVTSVPEICGSMPVYFSPFYPEDLYRALLEMTKNREHYAEKTKERFLEIEARQKQDLEKLMTLLLGE